MIADADDMAPFIEHPVTTDLPISDDVKFYFLREREVPTLEWFRQCKAQIAYAEDFDVPKQWH